MLELSFKVFPGATGVWAVPQLHRVYVGCEAGAVSVFEERFANGRTTIAALGEYRAAHAYSVSVDPATHRVYLPLQQVRGKPTLRILAARQ